MKRGIILFAVLIFLSRPVFATGNYKYDFITVKFVDSLSLEPITNLEIKVYPDGGYEQSKIYIPDSKGEIVIPVEAESYNFLLDVGDTIHYVSSGGSVLINILEKPEYTFYINPIFDIEVNLKVFARNPFALANG